ncbi:YdcF family protein [Rhodocytophaga rosea]|uniref:YdcF family protein n=1 Tax=Rhodocytophaga rosea TaxID=2704465 RepID=A0A6C0GS48_9BACT|nr:YdcF family protein [Rhodocytophaga rosea]QHT70925.1 YdcF family protein [Rhodocytophaga rosea]
MKSPAETVFEYLYLRDPVSKADVVIGFGHFDPKIPAKCGELYLAGMAPQIIFTGGMGAGTADLGEPEALYFTKVLYQTYPSIPKPVVITESTSANTGENLRFTAALLQTKYPHLAFDTSMQRVIIVANAYRQRRVFHTCQLYFSQVTWINCPPETSYQAEWEMFASKGENLDVQLVGETERLLTYPAKGFMSSISIPDQIMEAYHTLKESL